MSGLPCGRWSTARSVGGFMSAFGTGYLVILKSIIERKIVNIFPVTAKCDVMSIIFSLQGPYYFRNILIEAVRSVKLLALLLNTNPHFCGEMFLLPS